MMNTTLSRSPDVIDLVAIEAELRPKSTEELRFIFYDCCQGMARFLARAAVSVKLMDERGEVTRGMPMIGTFRRIFSGQISAELIATFIESPNRPIVERLPLADQKRIAVDPFVEVATFTKSGKPDKIRQDLRTAPKEIVKLVVGDDGIRPIDEQLAIIASQRTKAAIVGAVARKDEADKPQPELRHETRVKFTDDEWESIRLRAVLGKTEPGVIIRRFLAGTDAFKRPKV